MQIRLYQVFCDHPEPDSKPKVLALDTESSGLNLYDPKWQLTHLSWSYEVGVGYVCRYEDTPAWLWRYLEDPEVLKVGHNTKYDFQAIYKTTPDRIEGYPLRCTYIGYHKIDCTRSVSRNLKQLARLAGMPDWTAPLRRWQELEGNLKAWPPPEEILLPYAACDAVATLVLHEWVQSQLDEVEQNLDKTEALVERTAARMEMRGLHLNVQAIKDTLGEATQAMTEADEVFLRLTGLEDGPKTKAIASWQKLAKWLYTGQGVDCPKFTDKKNPSTDEHAFDLLLKRGGLTGKALEVVQAVQKYRGAKKLAERCTNWLTNVDECAMLHASLDAGGTLTGRYSARPNIQNMDRQGPVRSWVISRFDQEDSDAG